MGRTRGTMRSQQHSSRSPRSPAWIGWAILAAYWGLVGSSFLLRAVNDPTTDVGGELVARLGWGVYPTIGAVIVGRQPRNPVGWLCCGIGLLLGPAFFGQDYGWYALIHEPGSLPGGWGMAWLGQWPWYVALGLITLLVLLFPSGRLLSRRWRLVAWAVAAATAVSWLWAAFAPRPLEGAGLGRLANPLGVTGAEAAFEVLGDVVILTLSLLTVLAVVSQVVRFRRARGEERQQLKWFTYAALLSVLVWLVFIVSGLAARLPLALELLTGAVWLVGPPLGIGVAVLRYRLYDIDQLINRTLVYGLLTALLGLGYAGGVLVFGQLFGGVADHPPGWLVAGATLGVAALFQPARRRVQATVDRRFNRRRYDAVKTIEAFSARLRDQVDLGTLTAELLAVVNQTVEPTAVSLWLRPQVAPPGPPSPARQGVRR